MHFFLNCCTGIISRKEACEIIAANEGGSIEQRPTCHDCDAGHAEQQQFAAMYISEHIFNSLISNAGGEDFLVLEVLFKRDASRHDGVEFCVVHCTAAGSEVKFSFNTVFATQPMPAAKPVRVAASTIILTSLLSDMVV